MIAKAIQRIQELYSKGVPSKDTRLSSRHIYSVLCSNRSTVLSQQSTKKQNINEGNYQILECVDMEHVQVTKYSSVKIIRSKQKIPRIISDIDSLVIKDITSIDGSIDYDLINFGEQHYAGGNKFTSKKVKVYFKDDYLFLVISREIKSLTLIALFEDPILPHLFNANSDCKCENCECEDYRNFDFHLDNKTLRTVIDMSVDELVNIFVQMKQDKNNNGIDDNQNSGMVHQPQNPQEDGS